MDTLTHTLKSSLSLTTNARRLIDEVSEIYQNDDWNARRHATAALEQDRPAYWTRFGYSAAHACLLQVAAHGMPLRRALRHAYNVSGDWVAGLDTLVPLNDGAVIALAAEYADLGVLVSVDELIARRERRAAA